MNNWGPPILCKDCGADVKQDHHDEGFGHEYRCCDCYDLAMGVPLEVLLLRKEREFIVAAWIRRVK